MASTPQNITEQEVLEALKRLPLQFQEVVILSDVEDMTGVLYLNGKTTDGGATVQAEITGEICFAD